jgi:undecaprenyl-diphosphatase
VKYGVATICALLAAFALLAVLAGHDTPASWELDVVRTATDIPRPLGAPIELVMQLGRRVFVPVVALVVLVATGKVHTTLGIIVAGLLTGWGIDAAKDWSNRPRPVDIRIREAADGFGFPSGHTAVACAMAVVVASVLPARWRWAPFAVAAVVGLGRLYVGAHYPLDVVGGALWGSAVGVVVVAVSEALGEDRASARR